MPKTISYENAAVMAITFNSPITLGDQQQSQPYAIMIQIVSSSDAHGNILPEVISSWDDVTPALKARLLADLDELEKLAVKKALSVNITDMEKINGTYKPKKAK